MPPAVFEDGGRGSHQGMQAVFSPWKRRETGPSPRGSMKEQNAAGILILAQVRPILEFSFKPNLWQFVTSPIRNEYINRAHNCTNCITISSNSERKKGGGGNYHPSLLANPNPIFRSWKLRGMYVCPCAVHTCIAFVNKNRTILYKNIYFCNLLIFILW